MSFQFTARQSFSQLYITSLIMHIYRLKMSGPKNEKVNSISYPEMQKEKSDSKNCTFQESYDEKCLNDSSICWRMQFTNSNNIQ